jgi:hypothetical protein
MTSTHTAELPLPGIPLEARTVHVFPELGTNLIGVTPLTQAGCQIHFEGTTCHIKCPGSQTITCQTNEQGLWALHIDALQALTDQPHLAAMTRLYVLSPIVEVSHCGCLQVWGVLP